MPHPNFDDFRSDRALATRPLPGSRGNLEDENFENSSADLCEFLRGARQPLHPDAGGGPFLVLTAVMAFIKPYSKRGEGDAGRRREALQMVVRECFFYVDLLLIVCVAFEVLIRPYRNADSTRAA